jgi:hypothetical protein
MDGKESEFSTSRWNVSVEIQRINESENRNHHFITEVFIHLRLGQMFNISRTKVWYRNLKADHFEDLSIDGNSIKTNTEETEIQGMDWIHMAQNRFHWLSLLNTVISILAAKMVVSNVTSWATISF